MKITKELAELCGIIAGDGHLSRYISPRRTHYKISIFGHKVDDREYFSRIQPLFKKTLGRKLLLKDRGNYIELRTNSKELLEMFEKIGIPVGNKSGIVNVPEIIKKNNKLSLNFLRGLADTDFSVVIKRNNAVRITTDLKSLPLILDTCLILKRNGIGFCGPYKRERKRKSSPFVAYQIDINGRKNLEIWMKCIGFRNPKHLKKIKNIG